MCFPGWAHGYRSCCCKFRPILKASPWEWQPPSHSAALFPVLYLNSRSWLHHPTVSMFERSCSGYLRLILSFFTICNQLPGCSHWKLSEQWPLSVVQTQMSCRSSRDQLVGDTQLQASFPAGIRVTGRMWNLISLTDSPEGIKRIVWWQFIEDFRVFYKWIVTTVVWTHSHCLTWSRLPLSACLSIGGVKESRQLSLACGTQNPFSAPSPFLAVLGCVCMSMLFLPKPYGEETSHTQKVRGFLDVSRRATAPPRSGNASPRCAAGAWASITPARTTKDPQGSTARHEI